MSKATYPLKLPLSIKKAAQRLAKEDGVSLDQWIAVAVAEKVSALRTEEYFRERGRRADRPETLRILERAGKAILPWRAMSFPRSGARSPGAEWPMGGTP